MADNRSEEVLKVSDLHIRYVTDDATVYAVNGVSFSLKRGATIGLVGETGAGKTTTVLAMLGLVQKPQGEITSGDIEINGRSIFSLNGHELQQMRGKEIAMVFQDPMTSLNPVMRIGDQILEALEIHEDIDKHEAKRKAQEMLNVVRIPADRYSDYPHQLSGGMKQRVVIAIALACQPEILIADEPTTALDVTIQAQVLDLINELKKKLGTSTIMISHDLGIVAESCDDVMVMYAGRIVESGSVAEVFSSPKHPYTEGLFNSLPNMKDRKMRLSPIRGLTPDPTIEFTCCPFAERCKYAVPGCHEKMPQMLSFGGSHFAACCRYEDKDFEIDMQRRHG